MFDCRAASYPRSRNAVSIMLTSQSKVGVIHHDSVRAFLFFLEYCIYSDADFSNFPFLMQFV